MSKKVTKLVVKSEQNNLASCVMVTPNFTTEDNLRCMHCTLEITGRVLGCPTHTIVENIDTKHTDKRCVGEYMTYGVFCSYNCILAFVMQRDDDPLFTNSRRYLSIIASKENGCLVDIIPSPPIQVMRAYGGIITSEQYKTELGKVAYIANGTTITHPLTLVYTRK